MTNPNLLRTSRPLHSLWRQALLAQRLGHYGVQRKAEGRLAWRPGGGSIVMGDPQNGWSLYVFKEHLIKMNDLGIPLFWDTSICGWMSVYQLFAGSRGVSTCFDPDPDRNNSLLGWFIWIYSTWVWWNIFQMIHTQMLYNTSRENDHGWHVWHVWRQPWEVSQSHRQSRVSWKLFGEDWPLKGEDSPSLSRAKFTYNLVRVQGGQN